MASKKDLKNIKPKKSFFSNIAYDIKHNTLIYIMLIPIVAYYIVFQYLPMGGLVVAFKNFKPALGVWGSKWVGIEHFTTFFKSYYFWDLLRNTLQISLAEIVFGFPAPIILALLLNEIRNNRFKKAVQTITYMPHFISVVVMAGIVIDMVSSDGVVNKILSLFGHQPENLLTVGSMFIPIYVISNIWQNIGWGTIIYLSALTAISQDLYEAADIDGAGRFKKMIYVTLPGISPTIITLFIMRLGKIMTIGWEKIILLYNPAIYDKADVISAFVYRNGLLDGNYSYSAAVGLFNSVINVLLLFIANKLSKKFSETSIW